MKSTLGRRAMICKELGWSLEYVEHGISYAKLQMMMLDMPHYIDNNTEKKSNKIELTDDNEDEFLQMMMGHGARLAD